MWKFFIKFKYNFLLAFFITLLFVAVEQFYRTYNDILVFNLTFKNFLEQLLINFWTWMSIE